MAKVALVLDDVVLALKKGKRQIADDTVTLNIPANVSSTGKRRMMRLDVSDEGRDMLKAAEEARDKIMRDAESKFNEGLEKLKEEREKAESGAWRDLNAIADKVEEMRPKRRRGENSDESNDATNDDSADSGASDTQADSTPAPAPQQSWQQNQPSTPSYGDQQQNSWNQN